MARLREGRAHTGGAAHFLRETVGRVRYAGARGQLTVRGTAASTLIAWWIRLPQDGCPLLHTLRQHKSASRPYLKMPGRRFLDGRRRRCGRVSPTPRRCGSSSGV